MIEEDGNWGINGPHVPGQFKQSNDPVQEWLDSERNGNNLNDTEVKPNSDNKPDINKIYKENIEKRLQLYTKAASLIKEASALTDLADALYPLPTSIPDEKDKSIKPEVDPHFYAKLLLKIGVQIGTPEKEILTLIEEDLRLQQSEEYVTKDIRSEALSSLRQLNKKELILDFVRGDLTLWRLAPRGKKFVENYYAKHMKNMIF
jgi:hypothetical protein